jgi:HD-GYP domain-containing protein (c-di-GMP phosphodiesterase class II)
MESPELVRRGGDTQAEVMAELFAITQDLVSTHDEDFLLDEILTKARRFLRAEAGSIYQVKDKRLHFTYMQNDKLFEGSADLRLDYTLRPMPIDHSSLAGFVASTGQVLSIPDAYQIPPEAPYGFNKSYDRKSGYRTRSILMVPLMVRRQRVIGVLQIINALDECGAVVPFSPMDEMLGGFFANAAAIALERASMTREIILRTMRMAQLRDPRETAAHVNRVGGYSADIYAAWARSQGLRLEEAAKTRDLIRLAAMLHDVGKVAISDAILKKPGRLDQEEFQAMKQHTVVGARLFKESTSEMDQMAQEIALNHHEHWDGSGYPGHLADIYAEVADPGPGKQGQEIPISARITGLADVYDALMSRRVYKDPWPEDRVLDLIRRERGQHFDPLVVDAFFSTYETIRHTRLRFSEED